jgi:hypothetical protein
MMPGDGPPPTAEQRALLARSARLRARWQADLATLRPPLALADQARDAWQWLRAHPQWPAGLAVVLVVARPRRVLRWGLRLWTAWQWWRRLQLRLATAGT